MSADVLSQEELRRWLKRFRDEHSATYHLKKLGYFGSDACNEAKADSDVTAKCIQDDR